MTFQSVSWWASLKSILSIGKDAGLTEFVEIEKTQGGKAQM